MKDTDLQLFPEITDRPQDDDDHEGTFNNSNKPLALITRKGKNIRLTVATKLNY